jgi:hypothetical protein
MGKWLKGKGERFLGKSVTDEWVGVLRNGMELGRRSAPWRSWLGKERGMGVVFYGTEWGWEEALPGGRGSEKKRTR